LRAREITNREGIFVGWSSGSAFQGIVAIKNELQPSDVVVTLFHDHGSRYVGKIYNDDWMRQKGYLD